MRDYALFVSGLQRSLAARKLTFLGFPPAGGVVLVTIDVAKKTTMARGPGDERPGGQ
jgi:hypothetical protein